MAPNTKNNSIDYFTCVTIVIAIIIMIITIAVYMTGSIFIGSYVQYVIYVNQYNSTYDMTTGYPLNNSQLERLTCFAPFYKECTMGGLLGLFGGIFVIGVCLIGGGLIMGYCSNYIKTRPKSNGSSKTKSDACVDNDLPLQESTSTNVDLSSSSKTDTIVEIDK